MPIKHEIPRKPPPPPKHASRNFRESLPLQGSSSSNPLKPDPLSITRFSKMASSAQDSVTADGHLQHESAPEDAPAELTAVVDELLNGLSTKFSAVSTEIFAKMDDMSRRLDNLEANIQAGGDSTQSKQ
ncbi:MAG: hypothetical protein M1830_007862 [Pleopsidium flavum]|nr:MAG: hypothetical protein M1830_007862 [Pleopsidium flavum]